MSQRLIELALGGSTLLAAAAICWLLGRRLRPWLSATGLERGFQVAIELIAGVTLLHLLLSIFDLIGLRWRPLALLITILAVERSLHYLARRRSKLTAPLVGGGWGWGDSLAVLALGVFGLWAMLGWAVNPDFIYHWGIKGHRFFLSQAIDVAFLTQRSSLLAHPGYPNLLPGLFAATATLGRGFRPAAMFGWTALFGAALWPASRQVLRDCAVGEFTRQSTLAAVALVTAMFSIGYFLSGGPDTILALVPLAAWPAMLRAQGPSHSKTGKAATDRDSDLRATDLQAMDLHIGFIAALSASSKMEGIPLAALLVALYLTLRWRADRATSTTSTATTPLRPRALIAVIARTSLLPLAALSMWALRGRLSGLFVEQHGSGLHFDRLPTILSAMATAANVDQWHGVAWVVLLLPLLLWRRLTRPIALLCGLQLVFYFSVYLTAPLPDLAAIRFYVLTSFSRLLFHLVPATLVAIAIAFDGWIREQKNPDPAVAGDVTE